MRSTWNLQSIRLPVKFGFALGLLVVGLVFLGGAYYQTIVIEENRQERAQRLEVFRSLVTTIQIDIAEARILEKSLTIDKDLSYLPQFEAKMEKADSAITQLHDYVREDSHNRQIFELHEIIDHYRDAFYEGAQALMEVGLTGSSGLTNDIQSLLDEINLQWDWDYFKPVFARHNQISKQLEGFLRNSGAFGSSDEDDMEVQVPLILAQIRSFTEELEELATEHPEVAETARLYNELGDTFLYLTESMEMRDDTYSVLGPIVEQIKPRFDGVLELADQYARDDALTRESATLEMVKYFFASMGFMTIALAIAMSVVKFGIIDPIRVITGTLSRVREGDAQARTGLERHDELGILAEALDGLLDDKEESIQEKEQENKRINGSIIELIQSVFKLSQRDLTVRVPVAEDITGAVADSINQLAESIEHVLYDVDKVANQVNDTSLQVKAQSATVLDYSQKGKDEVAQTLTGLDSAIKAMQIISKLAVLSNSASQRAIRTSETAMDSVSQTVDSINKIRQTIHEAEKRIKRLGERSQEIGGIVSLINNISERTHVLSLNASMHAASAGEAGRGLMVVVDEVQRLAENSREATAEIENLVNNIQLETADTINVMNTVITDVVEGTELAELAGERMNETRATTQTLVDSVVRIAQNAARQAKVAQELRIRASSIERTTASTNDEMVQQALLSDDLVNSAAELQRSIRVFKLADAK